MKNPIYKIDGMTCGGCVSALTRAFEAANATEIVVELTPQTASVGNLDAEAIRDVVENAGFDFLGPV